MANILSDSSVYKGPYAAIIRISYKSDKNGRRLYSFEQSYVQLGIQLVDEGPRAHLESNAPADWAASHEKGQEVQVG